jgi:hypothetical protein
MSVEISKGLLLVNSCVFIQSGNNFIWGFAAGVTDVFTLSFGQEASFSETSVHLHHVTQLTAIFTEIFFCIFVHPSSVLMENKVKLYLLLTHFKLPLQCRRYLRFSELLHSVK